MAYRIEISSLHVPAHFNTMKFDVYFEHVDKDGERDGWVPHRWRYQEQQKRGGPTG